ncbi:MAG: peptidase M48, partial [Kiritimatiellaceae bacterium]|nr:peptidase M48 [Kiritimatiellaceae bacterium]
MDFFAQQDQARKHTGRLIVLFCIAVALTVLMVYFLPVAAWYVYWRHLNPGSTDVFQWWHPKIFIYVMEFTLFLVIGGSIYKICELRYAGGEGIATMMGGRAVHPESTDFFEKRLRNIVEEMAIASGIPVPSVYLLPRESGINAFVAGFNPSNATIAVTYGAMTGLTRDELQGIIAHEFSHILNNDMRINIHLVGLLHGLLLIGLTGRILTGRLFSGRLTRRSSRENQAHVMTLILGMLLRIIGWIGLFFCSVIKASISRSRERLADASAVQFTRNPDGLAGALEKIGGLYNGSRLEAWEADV